MAIGNLASRFLVAVIAVPIVLLIVLQHSVVPTWGLVLVASVLAMYEWFAMTLEDRTDRIASTIFGALACIAYFWMSRHTLEAVGATGPRWAALTDNDFAVLAFAVLAPLLYYLFRFGEIETVAKRAAFTIAGIVYAGLCFTVLAKIDVYFGGYMVIFVLVVAWIGDTGAYFAGRFLGDKKLYPAVSPKKTWAGAWGGLAGSIAGGLIMRALFPKEIALSWADVVLIAGPGAILGQMGDLAESLMKRSTGVKDSGGLLGGHGGLLDRVDAVLFLGPYLLLYVQVRAFIG
ncbi:MAG TPA: phosphatidate cytidylyltransferase [Kofleriaceae bacterium]|nr:phosphatidate cytidylyltransferase [Kofleriaceae bacterium]